MKRLVILIICFVCFKAYSKVMEFKWKSIGKGYVYKVQISKSENFYNLFVEEVVSSTNFLIDLPKGKYYFRVIPMWEDFEGDASFVVSFEIKGDGVDAMGEKLKYIHPQDVLENPILGNAEVLRLSVVNCDKEVSGVKYSTDIPRNFRDVKSNVTILLSSMDEGYHTVYYKAFSFSGKEGKIKRYDFKLDRSPPQIDLFVEKLKIGSREYIYHNSPVEVDIRDDSEVEWYIWMNGARILKRKFFIATDEEKCRITIFARDSYGNITINGSTFFIDRTPPEVVFKNVYKLDNVLLLTNPLLNFEVKDNTGVKEFFVSIDGNKYFANFIDLKGLAYGKYNINFFSTDFFGNSNSVKYSLLITNEGNIWKGYLSEERN